MVVKSGRVYLYRLYCGRVCGPDACPTCLRRRVKQLKAEIEHERKNGSGRLLTFTVDKNELSRVADNLSAYHTRHRKLPQGNGTTIIILSEHNELAQYYMHLRPLSVCDKELTDWLERVCRTPKDRCMSGNRTRREKETGKMLAPKWGGNWEHDDDEPGKSYMVLRELQDLDNLIGQAGGWPQERTHSYARYSITESEADTLVLALEDEGAIKER